MRSKVQEYYDSIAGSYEESRFKNSYGQFIDKQERNLIGKYLENSVGIDIACGTGRFMDFCNIGIDFSEKMLDVAKKRFPNKDFVQGDIHNISLQGEFNHAICFHVFMHLEKKSLSTVINQVDKIIKPNGFFIFDVASKERRNLSRSNQDGWHGSNSYTDEEVASACGPKWTIIESRGVLFFPIHRVPSRFRKRLMQLDDYLNSTWLKKYSSYRMYVLKKMK